MESELRVRLTGRYIQPATVYLVIPSKHVVANGYPADSRNNEYVFLTPDGKIPLPQGVTGYILTLGKSNDQVTLGKLRWAIGRSQRLSVQPGLTTKTTFDKAIAEMHVDAPQIDDLPPLIDSLNIRNRSEVRRLDSALLLLQTKRPGNCDCIIIGEAAAQACDLK